MNPRAQQLIEKMIEGTLDLGPESDPDQPSQESEEKHEDREEEDKE